MQRYVIFASVGLGLLMSSIDGSAVAVAFPNLIKDLGTNVLWAAWTISIYLVAITSFMPLMGNLSDIFGQKRVYLFSLILFTCSSCACGLAPNIYSLIAFRFLQGIGGASFVPTAAGIVSRQFPENRERAIGLFTSIFPIGGILGPNLGGWIVSQYSWRYIFFVNLPIGVCLLALILFFLPKDSKLISRPQIDFRGASLFFGAILFLMFGLNLIAENFSSLSLLLTITFLSISSIFLYSFFRQEAKHSNPIFDLALLKSRPFLAANVFNIFLGAGVFGIFSFIPLFTTSVLKLSTLASGMILTPRSLGTILTSALTSFFLKKWGYRWPMVLGTSLIAFSTILLGVPGVNLWRMIDIYLGVTGILVILIMFNGIGMGMLFPASNNACIELLPEKVTTIMGLRGMFRSVGGVLGISLITIILHLSSTPAIGFRITFIGFGLGLFCTIPLVFLMPSGKKKIQ